MDKLIALTVPGGQSFEPVAGMPRGGPNELQKVISFGVTSLLIVATLLSLAFLIMGGIQWTMSGGDKTAVDAARKKLTYAIIGLVVTFSAFLIINIVGSFFGINLLSPDCPIGQFPERIPGQGTICR